MYEYSAKVARVVDGDTIDLVVNMGFHCQISERFRLSGLNAAERGTINGDVATVWLTALLSPGTRVRVRTQLDKKEKFGRYLATIWYAEKTEMLDGRLHTSLVNVNEKMIAEGYAVPYSGGKR